jgi:NADH-quinone oxidoreductase subunit L
VAYVTLFAPLIAALFAGLFGKTLGVRVVNILTVLGVAASCAGAWLLFWEIGVEGGASVTLPVLTWLDVAGVKANWAIRLDTLSVVMLIVVTTVSLCVHVYSIGYMSHDTSRQRFMALLSLFTFAMLMLVTADNLVQLFFGWEGVGLASYLLIGFWNERDSANAAAVKAFVVNRVGDLGLALGIFAAYQLFGSVEFSHIFSTAGALAGSNLSFFGVEVHGITLVCLLLFVGAMGKSAQLGLHTWLPDAMEGPTPVSALIHAATMVTAGVFLLCRISPLLEYAPDARLVVMMVGAATAIFAASIGLTQFDIKRVIAYSTCSQLGYMVFAAGASAYGAAMFHLFTHAFFKALLFLGAGSVIHAMDGEQDLRRMGGLRALIPVTCGLMWLGSLALAGIPPFAGFYSKDMILEAVYESALPGAVWVYGIGVLAAALTAFYSWRLLFLAFSGKSRADAHTMAHVHESPWMMLLPLFVLGVGALGAGFLGFEMFVGDHDAAFWGTSLFILTVNDTVAAAHHAPEWVAKLPLLVAVLGIMAAFVLYCRKPTWPARISRFFGAGYRFLFNKWYWDELYAAVWVRPVLMLGRVFWQRGDVGFVDRFGPNGFAASSLRLSNALRGAQNGAIPSYALAMMVGIAIVLGIMLWRVIAV